MHHVRGCVPSARSWWPRDCWPPDAGVTTTPVVGTPRQPPLPRRHSAAGGDTTAAASGDLAALVEAATEEGQVNLIALPDSWANYMGILQSFRDKYPGIENPVATPDASSADELTAVKTLAGQADMPDSIDVGPPFAIQAIDEGLWEPYKASTWDEVPDALKDPDGNWVGAYYGIMAIGTNTTIVDNPPPDLRRPEEARVQGPGGDQRRSPGGRRGLRGRDGGIAGQRRQLRRHHAGHRVLRRAQGVRQPHRTSPLDESTVLSGETPINLDWTYNWPGLETKLEEAGITSEVVVPSDGVYGSYYAQGVVKDSPHPNAAKLWVEHILSDEGALGYLEGGAIPARYAALLAAGKVSEDIARTCPMPS